MSWPMSQDYNEAIQNPDVCFADPELKEGEVITNPLGIPIPCSGNFADVYAIKTPTRKWAVKCFTRQIPGLRERYVEISKYLQEVNLPFMVDFRYLEQGIRVKGQWYPVIKMHWVEGLTLNDFVSRQVDKPQVMRTLAQLWIRLAEKLREADVAHCDLQHGNVMLVPNNKKLLIRLVDYDGTCVPALELLKSIEVGHPNYQHPQRLREGTYNLRVDRFSHLVIYTAFQALAVGGKALWEKYEDPDSLLFRRKDFEAPGQSPIFADLKRLGDRQVAHMAEVIAESAQRPIDQVPPLEEVISPVGQTKVPVGVKTDNPFASLRPVPVSKGRRKQRSLAQLIGVITIVFIGIVGCAIWLGQRGGESVDERKVVQKDAGSVRKTAEAKPKTDGQSKTVDVTDQTKTKTTDTEPKPDGKPKPVDERPPLAVAPFDAAKAKELQERWAKYLGVPVEIENSIGMKLRLIPPGRFVMGTTDNTSPDELPHEVVLTRHLYMGVFEVTQAQYEKVMKTNPSYFSPKGEGSSRVDGFDTRTFPVERVSWNDANEFCKKLSALVDEKKEGRIYRLPTEAEWEYACRAGTITRYNVGDTLTPKQANYASTGLLRTTTVGSYAANGFALCDMHGNVWEWCADWYGAQYYAESPKEDPKGPESGNYRVLRGGCWFNKDENCRSADRTWNVPVGRDYYGGFRVVCLTTAKTKGRSAYREAERTRIQYLSDMQEFDVKVYRRLGKKGNTGWGPRITVNGVVSPNGISLHALSNDFSSVKYNLPTRARKFLASVALNDSAVPPCPTPLTFLVFGDRKLLWKSHPIQRAGKAQECVVDIKGVKVLELRVDCPGPFINAQAVWIEPRVEIDD
ncbi:MAG: hypothetical protein KatS3mg105_2354 [Gemmatales bacterium]|nr:MAG: hypothetical protein KatS3mg105_2354 [Gemmatales bacterium]